MTIRTIAALCAGLLAAAAASEVARAEPAGHVTGIGGVFFKAKDPKALAAWYRDVLGLPLQPWGGPRCATTRRTIRPRPPGARSRRRPPTSRHRPRAS